jgi:hypothetical protein
MTFLKIKKIVVFSAAITLLLSMFWGYGLSNVYFEYPRVPASEYGRVIPFEMKGRRVFITKEQDNFLKALRYVSYGAFAILIAVSFIHGGDPFKKPPPHDFRLPPARRRSWWFW